MNESERLAIAWTKAYRKVASYVSSMVPDFHQAEDILQQVAMVLVRKYPEYDHSRPFCGWALGIARLEIIVHLKRQGGNRLIFSDDLLSSVATAFEEHAADLDRRQEALVECVNSLPARSRMILEMRYADEHKPQAMAEHLGVTSEAVRALLYRMREALRDCVSRRLTKETVA